MGSSLQGEKSFKWYLYTTVCICVCTCMHMVRSLTHTVLVYFHKCARMGVRVKGCVHLCLSVCVCARARCVYLRSASVISVVTWRVFLNISKLSCPTGPLPLVVIVGVCTHACLISWFSCCFHSRCLFLIELLGFLRKIKCVLMFSALQPLLPLVKSLMCC